MTRAFRFAVQSGPFDDVAALRAHAREVERLGYAELFSFDHVGAVDPFVPLVVAAEATTTLRLGPLVLNSELHHPVLVARTAATFDALSEGRLVLGLGTGYQRSEHDAAGIPLRPPGARVDRFGEVLGVVRSLLDTGTASLRGGHLAVELDDLGVRPRQDRVPVLVGGHGRRVVELAARHADVFQFTGLTHDPVDGSPRGGGFAIADVQRRAAWLSEAAGERRDEIERSALVQVVLVGHTAKGDLDGLVAAGRLDAGVVDETPFVLAGSVEQIVDKLQRLRDEVGIHHYVVRDAEAFAPVVGALAGR